MGAACSRLTIYGSNSTCARVHASMAGPIAVQAGTCSLPAGPVGPEHSLCLPCFFLPAPLCRLFKPFNPLLGETFELHRQVTPHQMPPPWAFAQDPTRRNELTHASTWRMSGCHVLVPHYPCSDVCAVAPGHGLPVLCGESHPPPYDPARSSPSAVLEPCLAFPPAVRIVREPSLWSFMTSAPSLKRPSGSGGRAHTGLAPLPARPPYR